MVSVLSKRAKTESLLHFVLVRLKKGALPVFNAGINACSTPVIPTLFHSLRLSSIKRANYFRWSRALANSMLRWSSSPSC